MPPIRPSPARLVLATPLPRGPVRSIPCCYRSANKLLQTNPQAVDKLCSHCLFPVVVTSLEQAVNNLKQAWWHYQTCYKVVLTSLIRSWYNKNVTRLTTQGCNNIVISWLYRTCWNNLATSLIMSSNLLQVVNCSLFQTCWQLGTSSANTTCWRLVDVQTCYLYLPYTRKNLTSCSKSGNKSSSCVRTACPKLSTSLEQAVNNL
jgi:hypothetical protein